MVKSLIITTFAPAKPERRVHSRVGARRMMTTALHLKDVIFNSLSSNKLMYLDSAKKAELFEQFGGGATNTGSAESQIALFTYRIAHLTEHMKQNRKDHSTERALTGLVGKRRALLNYLKKRDINRYRAIVKALGLRK